MHQSRLCSNKKIIFKNNRMKSPTHSVILRSALFVAVFGLAPLLPNQSRAYPLGKVTFKNDAPFAGSTGNHSLMSSGTENLLTVSAWADTGANSPANLYQWFWLLGVDSGTGNGALIDGNESMTLDIDKSAGASMIIFFYTGGDGGSGNGNLARITISGFTS